MKETIKGWVNKAIENAPRYKMRIMKEIENEDDSGTIVARLEHEFHEISAFDITNEQYQEWDTDRRKFSQAFKDAVTQTCKDTMQRVRDMGVTPKNLLPTWIENTMDSLVGISDNMGMIAVMQDTDDGISISVHYSNW